MLLARRLRAAVVLCGAAGLFALAACGPTDTPGQTPSNQAGATSAAPSQTAPPDTNAVTGEPVGSVGDPCALLTPADVKDAFGQNVLAMKRLGPHTDEDGTTQQCAISTNGTPMDGSGFAALSAMASGMSGQSIDLPPVAAIGVVRASYSVPADVSEFNAADLPPGSKKLSGVGLAAIVLALPKGSFGMVVLTATTGFYIYDLEGRAVPTAEMEKLLRAAAGRA